MMNYEKAMERARGLNKEGVLTLFECLDEGQREGLRSKVISTLYDRVQCRELGIDYVNVGLVDMARSYVFHAYMAGMF
jgi:hypothetical protein